MTATNVDADTIKTDDEAREALIRQVTAPVRWEASVRLLIDEGVNTFVEVGPGKVLTGLLRQIDRSVAALNVALMSWVAGDVVAVVPGRMTLAGCCARRAAVRGRRAPRGASRAPHPSPPSGRSDRRSVQWPAAS